MDKSRKIIENSIKSGDIDTVRATVLDILENKAGKAGALETVQMAVKNAKGLFEPDDDNLELKERDKWTAGYSKSLADALRRNFSREKLACLLDVNTAMARDPNAFREANRAEKDAFKEAAERLDKELYKDGVDLGEVCVESDPAGDISAVTDAVAERNAAERNDEEDESNEISDADNTANEYDAGDESGVSVQSRPSHGMKILGYIIMILALAVAIVGICVPVRFLIGLGIGLVMLGSVVVYFNIRD